jgi:hypothetical protein
MKTRLVLQLTLGLGCVLPGGLREAAVCGQTPSGYPRASQPAESPGQRLYQELIVTQKSVCRVQGLDSRCDLRYAVLSSLDLNQRNDGSLEVKQKVAAAKLREADEATRALFGSLVQKLPGATFTMRFSPQGELVRFEGAQDKVQAAAGPAVDQAVLLASLIDRDGWKELARYSFFQPPKPLQPGARWEQSMTHSWGSLGSWTGQVAYRFAGQQGDVQQFPYAFKLTYVPPKSQARDQLLPISRASFQHGASGGTISFDPTKRRVTRIEERFQVKGQMTIEVLGQELPLDLDEDQSFRVRLLERDPRGHPAVEPSRYGLQPQTAGSQHKASEAKPPEHKAPDFEVPQHKAPDYGPAEE